MKEQTSTTIQHDRAFNEMMKLFNEKSFTEKWKATFKGLNSPKSSGEYKFAKLQIQLMTGPILAMLIPVVIIGLLLSMPPPETPNPTLVTVLIDDNDPAPPLDPAPLPEPPFIPPFDPIVTPYKATYTPPEIDNSPRAAEPTVISVKPAPLNAVANIKSVFIMPGILTSRTTGQRSEFGKIFGEHSGGEDAVMRSLRWLKSKQLPDGSWPGQATANTGLALLCFLAHGETTDTGKHPEFGETVEKGLQFLLGQQKDNGYFKSADDTNYAHLIGTYALAEAYTLTRVPMIKTAVEKAVKLIIDGQHESGGWDYNMRKSDRDDTSYAGWAAQALKAAHMARDSAGLDAPGLDEACKSAIQGFKKNAHERGGFGYTECGQGGLSGVGALCMQLLGAPKEREVSATLDYLKECKFSFAEWDVGQPRGFSSSPIYYWYYITQAKFQHGGNDWTSWNNQFAPELIRMQQILKSKNAYQDHEGKYQDIGYWDSPSPTEHDGHKGGEVSINANRWAKGSKLTDEKDCTTTDGQRIQITALCALQMMVYSRYLPTFMTPKAEEISTPKPDVDEIKVNVFLQGG